MKTEDEHACLQLCVDYCHLVDAGEFEAFSKLFVEDGLLDLPGRRMEGRKAILETVGKRPPSVITFHFGSNSRISGTGEDQALGSTYILVFRHEGGGPVALPAPMTMPVSAGIYDDHYERTVEGWRFRSRILRPFFRN